MSFKIFSNRNNDSKEFSIKSCLTVSGILSSSKAIYKGEIDPFKGVRSSCENDDNTFVL